MNYKKCLTEFPVGYNHFVRILHQAFARHAELLKNAHNSEDKAIAEIIDSESEVEFDSSSKEMTNTSSENEQERFTLILEQSSHAFTKLLIVRLTIAHGGYLSQRYNKDSSNEQNIINT